MAGHVKTAAGDARAARGRRLPADLGPRVAVALPAAAVTVALILVGGAAFACAVAALGALAAVELTRATGAAPLLRAAAGGAVAALVLAALTQDRALLLGLLAAGVALVFTAGAADPRRPGIAGAVGAGVLAAAWIGLGLAHGVLLRELPGGAGLLLAVLLGTFLGDTAAQLVGSAWGHRALAPAISPAKSVEGAAAGLVVATVVCSGAALMLVDGLTATRALALGAAVAVAAPAGDLFESLLKRDLGIKDTGTFFGAHGGVLDRIDAVLLTAVTGYYVSLAVL
ncbi:MAG: phosphatidate cytidylyltransferase [Solirubrobacteraceae bacterium MAG38_C4-C5]|nr:phosphatidate cytidylyltransferase [Candidatus Siliceabacter maunaloa]